MLVRSLNYFDTSSRNVVEKENWNIPANSFSLLSFPSLFREEESLSAKAKRQTLPRAKAPPPPPRNYPQRRRRKETAADSMINKFIVLFRHAAHGPGRSDIRGQISLRAIVPLD